MEPKSKSPGAQDKRVIVAGEPGICGFPCTIRATKTGARKVSVEIISECRQIRKLSTTLTEMSLTELFMPLTRNPAYVAAEQARCHASCVVPAAVLKAVEVALEMALPKQVRVDFLGEDDPTRSGD